MTPEQINIAIAEAVKFDCYVIVKNGNYYRPNAGGYTSDISTAWKLPKAEAKKYEMYADRDNVPFCEKVLIKPAPIPDFYNDLNACAEMEARLTDEEYLLFEEQLLNLCDPNNTRTGKFECTAWIRWASATAPQRCEAFVRVKGLWKEEV